MDFRPIRARILFYILKKINVMRPLTWACQQSISAWDLQHWQQLLQGEEGQECIPHIQEATPVWNNI